MNLVEIHYIRNLISERDIDHPLMNGNAQGLESSQLLSTTRRPRGHERAKHFPYEGSFSPQLSGAVPESFPLRGEISVARGDAYHA
jgi:hypothetical protein